MYFRPRTALFVIVPLVAALCVVTAILGRRATSAKLATEPVIQEINLDGPTTQPGELPIFWNVPEFSYIDQQGHRTSQKDLLGHVWVTDFIFTQCTSSCPTMTAKMVIFLRQMTDPNVRFVSFSVDPVHDTPDVLKQYAARWNADETRWILLSTDEKSLQETTREMNVTVHDTGDADNPILHSNLFFLIDAQGRVRGIYNSRDPEAMERLYSETTQLISGKAGSAAPILSSSIDGQHIYTAMGCAACHNDARLGPPLMGLFGKQVMLDGGGTIAADAAYLRQSILDPPAKIVAGYRATMPSYGPNLTDQQVTRLVDYLGSMQPASPAEAEMLHMLTASNGPTTNPFLAVDPVCKMDLTVTGQTQRITYEGKIYYFCSDDCESKFKKEPQKYAMK
jgi:protein SCO1/2